MCHFLHQINLQKEGILGLIVHIFLGWLPFVMAESCDSLSKVSPRNHKSVLNAVTVFVKGRHFELVFGGSKQ